MHFVYALTICAIMPSGPPPETATRDLDIAGMVQRLDKSNSTEERQAALMQIAANVEGSGALEYLPAVHACLNDPDSVIRRQAAYTVFSIRSQHPYRCPERVLALMFDDDEDVRYAATIACGAFDTYSETAFPLLLRGLKSADRNVRGTIPFGLKYFAYRTPGALEALQHATKDEDIMVRNNAHVALWHVTGDLDVIVPFWLECMAAKATGKPLRGVPPEEPGTFDLYAVAAASQFQALTESRPRALGIAIGKQLPHESPAIRGSAAHILGAMARNEEAERALRQLGMQERLKLMLNDRDENVQTSARLALSSFDQK